MPPQEVLELRLPTIGRVLGSAGASMYRWVLLPADNDRCPLLVDGRCSVYNARPMICRLFGAVEGMICKHGCKPADLLTDDEGFDLVTALSKL